MMPCSLSRDDDDPPPPIYVCRRPVCLHPNISTTNSQSTQPSAIRKTCNTTWTSYGGGTIERSITGLPRTPYNSVLQHRPYLKLEQLCLPYGQSTQRSRLHAFLEDLSSRARSHPKLTRTMGGHISATSPPCIQTKIRPLAS